MNNDHTPQSTAAGRKTWKAPSVRAVIPSKRTAGGNIPAGFEGPVYDIS